MLPGREDATVRAAVIGLLVDNYRADGPNLHVTALAESLEAPLPQVAAICAELVEAGFAYGAGDPVSALRLNDNGFAVANDELALGLLERHQPDESP